jgi:hypothetical protein
MGSVITTVPVVLSDSVAAESAAVLSAFRPLIVTSTAAENSSIEPTEPIMSTCMSTELSSNGTEISTS